MVKKRNDYLIIGINLGDYGSTGNIMINSLEYAHINGPFDVLACIPYETKQQNIVRTLSFGVKIGHFKHYYYAIQRRLKLPIINDGNYYKCQTKKLINIIKSESYNYKKTIIHIHNLHMCNIHVDMFYKWLAKNDQLKVLYTMHDTWVYTGGCYYYDHLRCNKWKTSCKNCPQNIKYSDIQLKKRTQDIKRIKNLLLIPCSKWLYTELKESKLRDIPAIINQGETSLEPFKGDTTLKTKLGIENKKVLISVSAYWNDAKGISYLYDLSNKLPKDYVLLLVGDTLIKTTNNIIHIKHIDDSNKLAEFYSIADAFVSVTQADNLPLVIMEAQLCGLPIVGFGHGGTPEEITEKSGIMVGTDNNIDKLLDAIIHVVETKPYDKKDIVRSGERFRKYSCAKRQLSIYLRSINE